MRGRTILGATASLIFLDVSIWLVAVAEGYAHPPITELLSHIEFLTIAGIIGATTIWVWNLLRDEN